MKRALIVFLLAFGCSSASSPATTSSADSAASDETGSAGETGSVAEAGGTDDSGAAEETASPYPPGPYGIGVGATLADISLMGYLRDATTGLSSDAPYGAVSFGTLRSKSIVKYALIHVGGYT